MARWTLGTVLAVGGILLLACGDDASSASPDGGATASDAGGSTPDANGGSDSGVACNLSYDAFNSSAKVNAQSTSHWSCSTTTRLLTGNGIPEHAVVGGHFATPISAQSLSITFPLAPVVSSPSGTSLSHQPYGYALNSVKLDPGTDGTCASTATSTAMGGGCVAIMGRDPWNLEAIGGAFQFGTDENNAHVQPNGQYHYHGMPEGSLTKAGQAVTLIGFAVDGFPVYARYGFTTATDATSAVKVIVSSWQKKANPDAGRPSTSTFPMGTFTQDYEYVAGSGDLDECNGRTGVTPDFPNGTYHYYITDTFPFIQRCLKGTPL